jgi:hypothetical protein
MEPPARVVVMKTKLRYDQSTSLYHKAHHHISVAIAPVRGISVAAIISISISCFLAYWDRQQSVFQVVSLFISSLIFFTSLLLSLLLIYRGIGYAISEPSVMSKCIGFLVSEAADDAAIENLKTRAEIGSSISPIRALVPILLIPICISILQNNVVLPLQSWLIIGMLLTALFFPLALDTYNAGIDSFIRHAVAEFRYLQSKSKTEMQSDSTLLLTHLLQTQPLRSVKKEIKQF